MAVDRETVELAQKSTYACDFCHRTVTRIVHINGSKRETEFLVNGEPCEGMKMGIALPEGWYTLKARYDPGCEYAIHWVEVIGCSDSCLIGLIKNSDGT